MLSIISGAIVFVCASYIGIEIQRHYKKRLKLIEELIDFFSALINNLSYTKEPIPTVVNRFCISKKGEIVTILNGYLAAIASDETSYCIKTTLLKKPESMYLAERLICIGKTNILMETKQAESAREYFKEVAATAKKELETNGKLAYKLGVLLGIALMVILV